MRELDSTPGTAGTTDELTGLTEHLRRQTGRMNIHSCNEATSPTNGRHHQQTSSVKVIIDPVVARQKQALRHAKIDRFFLVLFPLLFLLFNCIYWVAYYYAHPVIETVENNSA